MIRGNTVFYPVLTFVRSGRIVAGQHSRTGSPQKNTAMDEISLLSLSTTELCHC